MDLELIKKAVDCLDLPIFIFSNDGSCKYSNSIFLDLIDSKASDKSTLDCSSFWPSFSETLIKNGRQKINFITQQGKKFRVLLDFTGISDEFCLAVVSAKSSDGDDSKDLHKQRIETLGVLAGGIAHDFNNILAGILGHITYLKTILPKEGKHSESLLAIEEGGRKAAKLTQEILNYSRLEEVEKAFPIDPKLVIDRSCSLLRGAFPPNVSIHVNSVEHPIQILADEAKLSQVVVNLLMNAKDALNNNGEIKLDLELMSACDELKQAFNGGDLGASKYLVLRVKDNGSGISPENLKKIFDPYYSTKGLRGTGIGLATVKSIITEFGGAIKVFSEVGKGTEFVIYLPSVLELNDKSSSET
ncbi:MAG: hypothetical protein KDD56_03640, partial [Bdellovibrionales bacterium]|nr:hypothetical protein [Bdellovibrionales bacterium]